MSKTFGILHPGQMGISIAVSAQNSGNTVYWASAGRSEDTRARATEHGLQDAGTVADLCAACDVVVSVCPPHAAEDVATEVASYGFDGLFVDANAISPGRAVRIGEIVRQRGATFVDGGIVGPPAWKPNATWLYLAGPHADDAAACFAAGPLETRVMGEEVGQASALKMVYAAYTKGTTALLCAILGTAEALHVREALEAQWTQDGRDLGNGGAANQARNVTAKAWRFEGEMVEISRTFEEAGLPGGFHAAAADVYARLAGFKDAPETPSLDAVLAALLGQTEAAA